MPLESLVLHSIVLDNDISFFITKSLSESILEHIFSTDHQFIYFLMKVVEEDLSIEQSKSITNYVEDEDVADLSLQLVTEEFNLLEILQ